MGQSVIRLAFLSFTVFVFRWLFLFFPLRMGSYTSSSFLADTVRGRPLALFLFFLFFPSLRVRSAATALSVVRPSVGAPVLLTNVSVCRQQQSNKQHLTCSFY